MHGLCRIIRRVRCGFTLFDVGLRRITLYGRGANKIVGMARADDEPYSA